MNFLVSTFKREIRKNEMSLSKFLYLTVNKLIHLIEKLISFFPFFFRNVYKEICLNNQ